MMLAPPALAADATEALASARRALARGDGIGAEARLRDALKQGARRDAIAAFMGEALLIQGRPERARQWLHPSAFSRQTAATGYRALARLERTEGNLPAAGRAFDRAIALTPKDPALWVEVGRLRYAGAEHMLALDAADLALKLGPRHARALEFKGQLVRDRFGLVAALPWFEAALAQAPSDLSVLGEMAATLGEMGRAHDMLAVTRKMLSLDPVNPRAFYLQAVMAARAGDDRLARAMLNRTGGRWRGVPGAILLEGVLELRAGNANLASQRFELLLRRQPANSRARLLLARTLYLAGEHRQVIDRFAPAAAQDGAAPYLLTVVARSHEALDQRGEAAALLDRAGWSSALSVIPVRNGSPVGALLAEGRADEAARLANERLSGNPGSAENQILAGDVALARSRGAEALERYRIAARVRLPEALMQRMVAALVMDRQPVQARALAASFLAGNPQSREAALATAWLSANAGDWPRARLLLEHARQTGGMRDATSLADLAVTQLRTGDATAAEQTAQTAYRLHRASPAAAQTWALTLAAGGGSRRNALALLAKGQQATGDTPLIREARRWLARRTTD